MSYALFSDNVKISPVFPTKSEVWQHAAQRGLVMELSSGEEDPPRRILNMGYAINSSAPDKPDASGRDIMPLVATRSINPPSATAAS